MASQTASLQEAMVARRMLDSLRSRQRRNPAGTQPGIETRRVLTREEVMAAPSETRDRREVLVRYPSGRWISMLAFEVDWEVVREFGLQHRFV